jgi:hypothetical protein
MAKKRHTYHYNDYVIVVYGEGDVHVYPSTGKTARCKPLSITSSLDRAMQFVDAHRAGTAWAIKEVEDCLKALAD